MPELPEVETIKRGLKKFVLNKKIVHVDVKERKSFNGDEQRILNKKIVQIRRKGKALLIDLDDRQTLMIHLRMTGQIVYRKSEHKNEEIDLKESFAGGHPNEDFLNQMPNKHTRVILELDEGKIFFNDQRKFGFMKIMATKDVEEEEFIRELGPEPWEMTGEELWEKLQKHKKMTIKGAILDQKIIAGAGNIYADEALFLAGILPMRWAGTIQQKEAEKIIRGLKKVMEKSIELGGSTLATYVGADGKRGNYLDAFANVYHREGEKCKKCGALIKKTRVAGRGTHYCPVCQGENDWRGLKC